MPSMVKLPHVDNVVDRLVREFEAREGGGRKSASKCISIGGAAGSGRSEAISQLSTRLKCAIPVVPPTNGLDGPIHALAQCASSLRAQGVNGLLNPIFDPKASLETKVTAVCEGLKKTSQCVLLMDVPDRWMHARHHQAAASYTSARGQHVLRELVSAARGEGHSVIIAGGHGWQSDEHISLASRSSGDFLGEPSRWGKFEQDAQELAEHLGDEAELTPLTLRVGVALVALGGDPSSVAQSARGGYAELQRLLSDELRRGHTLAKAWRLLGLARFAIPANVLETLVEDLPRRLSGLLRQVLLLEGSGGYLMHPSLRRIGRVGEDREASRKSHEAFALACAGRAKAPQERHADTVAWLESLHHYAGAGRFDKLKDAPDVSYWTSLGRSLSLAGDFQSAVRAYRCAVDRQETHAYAQAYLGFNLDRIGDPEVSAEHAFARAVALEPDNPWWNRRLVLALIRRGKIEKAHAAWLTALAHVENSSDPDEWLQENLFKDVARAFLARGELDYAGQVLELVPKNPCRALRELAETLAFRRDAMRLGSSLFPEGVRYSERWKGPQLDAGFEPVAWFPGYIVSVGENVVVELGEQPSEDGADPTIFRIALDVGAFRSEASLPPKRVIPVHAHVEMHVDSDDERTFLLHPTTHQHASTTDRSDLLTHWPAQSDDGTDAR